MRTEDQFVREVLEQIPPGSQRHRIEMDIRASIAERVEHGQSVDAAIEQFGDARVLAESYLEGVELKNAGFFDRIAAKLVDFFVIFGTGAALVYALWQFMGNGSRAFWPTSGGAVEPAFVFACVIIAVVLCPAYFVLAEFYTGQTLGKAMMGLHVVRESGARISFVQSLVRQLPLAASILVLDAIFVLFTEKNQRAFELISKTRVVASDL